MSSVALALIRQAVCTQNMSFFIRDENGKRYHLEPPEEDHLMNAAESVNVISDSPTAPFDFAGTNISFLTENDAYKGEMRSTGTQGVRSATIRRPEERTAIRRIGIFTLEYRQNGTPSALSNTYSSSDSSSFRIAEARQVYLLTPYCQPIQALSIHISYSHPHFIGGWHFSFPISLRKFRLSVQERMFPDRSKSRPNGPHISARISQLPLLRTDRSFLCVGKEFLYLQP